MKNIYVFILVFHSLSVAAQQPCDSVNTEYDRTYQNHGAMFNVVAYSPIILDHVTANIAWNTAPYELYYKVGGFQGYENSSSAWTLIGTATVTSNNTQTTDTVPTVIPININQAMIAGDTIALYLTSSPVSKMFLRTTTVPWGTFQFANADLGVSIARSMYQLFGVPFSTPQIWNGSVAYCADGSVGLDDQETPSMSMLVVNGELQLTLSDDILSQRSSLSVVLHDMTGRTLLNKPVSGARMVTPIHGLTSGAYVVSVINDGEPILSRKLMLP